MIIKTIKKGEIEFAQTNAPANIVANHYNTEYLCDTDLKEYLNENGFTYDVIEPCITLNYDVD